jgi:hypothetical protein
MAKYPSNAKFRGDNGHNFSIHVAARYI